MIGGVEQDSLELVCILNVPHFLLHMLVEKRKVLYPQHLNTKSTLKSSLRQIKYSIMRPCCDEISAYLPPLVSSLQPLLEFLQGHLPPWGGGQWLRLAFVPGVIGMLQDHLKRLA